MTEPADLANDMSVDAVRAAWDHAADAYVGGQATGRDHHRYAFFGPAQVSQCGDVRGRRVLDLGCGGGYFAREMARGGASVIGVDVSPRMIEHARATESAEPLGIDYEVLDAADVARRFEGESFDLVTSCFALHDMPDPAHVLRGVHAVLRPAGRLIATIPHPCTDTPSRQWLRDAAGAKLALAIDRYFERGPITCPWKGWAYDFTTPSVHATLEDWFGWLDAAGLRLRALREPRPDAEALRLHPGLEDAARVPYVLLLDVARSTR